MDHVKVIVASEDPMIRGPLINYFSEWGMETLEFTESPKISTVEHLSPQLIFAEKNFSAIMNLSVKVATVNLK